MAKAAVKQQWLGTVVDEKGGGSRKKRCVLKKGSRREVVLGRRGERGFIGTVGGGGSMTAVGENFSFHWSQPCNR